MRKFLGGIVILTISTSLISGSAVAKPRLKKYPKNLFSLSLLHFDASRSPHGLDWYTNSTEGKVILGTIATTFGVAPIYVAMASSVIPPPTTQGAQTSYRLPLAAGYVPCAATITVQSIVPAAGEPHSTINAAINPTEIQMTTVTPVLGLGKGQSWAEGDIAYYGIKREYLDEFIKKGVCKAVTAHVFLYTCHNQPECNNPALWGNPAAAAKLSQLKMQRK